MMESPLKPPLLQAILALLLLTGEAVALLGLAASGWDGDPFAVIGLFFAAPLIFCLATWQYRGTFQGDPRAAGKLGIAFYLLAGFCLFGYVSNVGEHFQRHGLGSNPLGVLLALWVILVPVVIFAALGRISRLRSRQLHRLYAEHPELQPRRQFTLRELLIGVGVLAVACAIVVHLRQSASRKTAEHVDAATAGLHLPAGASDVSFSRGFRGTIACEFTTDEPRFREWVAAGIGSIESELTKSSLEEIAGPYTIRRYLDLVPNRTGLDEVEIHNGLKYEWRFEDRGVHAAFDRTTGRGYYYAHFH